MATAPMPTPTRPTVEAVVSEASVNPRSPVFESVGMTAPRTTRSKPSRATASQHSRTGQELSLAVLVGGAAVRGLAMVVLLVPRGPSTVTALTPAPRPTDSTGRKSPNVRDAVRTLSVSP